MLPTITDLLNSLNQTIFRTSFYSKCVNYLKNSTDKDKPIYEVSNNPYILEPLRLYLLKNPMYLYLSDVLPDQKDIAFREYTFTEKSIIVLLKQIQAIQKKSMLSFCDNVNLVDIKYLLISDVPLDSKIQIQNNHASLSLLLGIKSLEILEYFNIERICDNLRECSDLIDFYRAHDTLTTTEKERTIILDVLTMIGNVKLIGNAKLIDSEKNIIPLYASLGASHNDIRMYQQKIMKTNQFYYILFKDRVEDKNKNVQNDNVFDYLTKELPSLEKIANIYDVIADPTYHFHFMGMKIISLELYVQYIKKQSRTNDFVSLLSLEYYNNYQTKICFPNLVLQNESALIYRDQIINDEFIKIKQQLKNKYDIVVSLEDLNNKIFKCRDKPFEIYETRPLRNKFTNEIIAYHTNVMNYYIKHYLNKNKLLDIGAGPLRQVEYYEKIGFKHLVAIEPSKESIKTGNERYNEKCNNLKLDFIEGVGDEVWLDNDTYKIVIENKPYKSILFKFTIHYMIKNLDILLDNLQNVIDSDTIIVISCIDGNKLKKLMLPDGRYEIKLGNTLLYGAYDFPSKDDTDNYKQIMIYFKGVYGVESGSIEYIVDINYLIEKFKQIGFDVITSKNFMDITADELVKFRENYNDAQKNVTELHHLLVLGKQANNDKIFIDNSKEGIYKKKYKKYKIKYHNYKTTNLNSKNTNLNSKYTRKYNKNK